MAAAGGRIIRAPAGPSTREARRGVAAVQPLQETSA